MKEFNKLCKEFEQMDAANYNMVLDELSSRIIPALQVITQDGFTGEMVFARFLLGAVVSDGKLSEDEYVFMQPMLRQFFGEYVDFEQCKTLIKENKTAGKDLKTEVDDMVDMLGLLSEDLKDDIVLVCLMVCAVDGKVSAKEKRWIKQLINE